MSYVVLARRYRPKIFADLIGQEHVSKTLQNALVQNRLAHAYLFTGPRGVGKTSAARILAKAIRCEKPGPDREPCNQCDSCTAINAGSSLDVIEIDAASNTGVDNIRALRENVEYSASSGTFRIYIIDEVHMLSAAAFNALLKTLEEPPPHVIFIFATTEAHKVLATIQSRCQKFDFKKIPAAIMTENLRGICAVEGIEVDAASLETIVLESEGCLRDAQSLLDQAIALCGKKIQVADFERAMGLLDRGSLKSLILAMVAHDPGASLKICSQMAIKGIDAKVILDRLVDFWCELHYQVFAKVARWDDVEMNALIAECGAKLAVDEVVRAMDLCLRTQASLNSSSNTQMALEALVVKLSIQRPAMAVATYAAPAASAPRASSPAPNYAPPSAPRSSAPAPSAPVAVTPSPAPSAASGDARGRFEDFIRAKKPAWTPVLQSLVDIKIEGNRVTATAKGDFAGKRLQSNDGLELLKTAFGSAQAVVQLEAAVAKAPLENPEQKLRDKRVAAKENEAVQAAIKIFDAVVTGSVILDDKKDDRKN